MAVKPTPAQPWVVNADGSVDVLLWQGRNFRAAVTHSGLANPAGYKARCGFKAAYTDPDDDILVAASTDDYIALTQLPANAGTRIDIDIPDEVTEAVTAAKGRWDLVLEAPSGDEDTVLAGDFVTWFRVTP